MNFNSVGSSNGAKYAAAGKAVANSAANVFDVQRKTGPDYAGLSQAAMKAKRDEKIAGIKAAQKVTQVGIAEVGNVQTAKNKIEGLSKSADIKRNSRKAGALGAIGKIVGAGYLASRDNTKDRPYPTAKDGRDGLMASHQTKIDEINKRRKDSADKFNSTINNAGNSSGGGATPGKVTGGSSSSTSSSSTSNLSGIRSEAFTYLTKDKGLSRNKALGIIANVDRESGWDPKIKSGDDGGPGGLFQWKGSRQTSTVSNLVNSGDWKGQLDYALSEPGEAYSQTYQQTTFDSPQQAADAWMTHWERPADTRAGSSKHTDYLSGYGF